MSDLINREDVDKAIRTICNLCGEEKRNNGVMCGACNLDSFVRDYDDIPSAEPERRWIPFDVALPKNRQKVLCVNKHDEMMVGGYMSDYGMTFPCYFEKPIAWMPLPEPWRGV